jgi:hypothetical protein
MSSEMVASVMLSGGKAPFEHVGSLSAEAKGTMSIKALKGAKNMRQVAQRGVEVVWPREGAHGGVSGQPWRRQRRWSDMAGEKRC